MATRIQKKKFDKVGDSRAWRSPGGRGVVTPVVRALLCLGVCWTGLQTIAAGASESGGDRPALNLAESDFEWPLVFRLIREEKVEAKWDQGVLRWLWSDDGGQCLGCEPARAAERNR